MTTSDDLALLAGPEDLVAAIPCPWLEQDPRAITEAFGEYWHEALELTYTLEANAADPEVLGRGQLRFEDGTLATLILEAPTPELVELSSISPMPFTETELVLLHRHLSSWRVVIPAGRRHGRRAAKRMAQLWSAFIAAGACGVFLPGLVRLHSPGLIKKETMDLSSPQALTNLFINAWHEDGWMRTRGLTPFGLPELETPTGAGLNGAYFCLMDVAANMLFQMAPYPPEAVLQIGPKVYSFEPGPRGPAQDDEVPVCGAFGVMSILPK